MTADFFIKELFLKRGGGNTPKDYRVFATLRGNPQKSFRAIHIAGSNGKGSVATKIAAGLEEEGKKVGLFTSPHLISFEERITINGKQIDREEVAARGREIVQMAPYFNFFEVTTFIAFEYFRDQQVDVAVIETGIGGGMDVTNLVDSVLSVITSISLEHTDVLGETIDEIAQEKALIIKPWTPAILGPTAALKPMIERARRVGSPLTLVEPVEGPYALENSSIARAAMELLGLSINAIKKGCETTIPCRFERRGNWILDVAHNPASFMKLKEALQYHYPGRSFPFVVGLCSDKDVEGCLRAIAPVAERIMCTQAASPRAMPAEKLATIARKVGIRVTVERVKTATDLTVICGSFYLMEEAIMEISFKLVL